MSLDANKTQLGSAPSVDPNRTVMGAAPSLNATQTIKPVQCPVCKTFNPVGVMFCVECGLIFDRALPADAFGAPAVQLPVLVDPAGREHHIRPGTSVIGRQGDIQIDDQRMSRRHAELASAEGAITVRDLGSTNGTLLNGQPLGDAPMPIADGDVLSLGGYELRMSSPGAASRTEMPAGGRTAAMAAPPAAAARAWLLGEDLRAPLKAGNNSVGRKPENDVQIAQPFVSGRHLSIEVGDDGLRVTDLGSTNGTLVAGNRLVPNEPMLLEPGQTITIGSMELRIEIEEPG